MRVTLGVRIRPTCLRVYDGLRGADYFVSWKIRGLEVRTKALPLGDNKSILFQDSLESQVEFQGQSLLHLEEQMVSLVVYCSQQNNLQRVAGMICFNLTQFLVRDQYEEEREYYFKKGTEDSLRILVEFIRDQRLTDFLNERSGAAIAKQKETETGPSHSQVRSLKLHIDNIENKIGLTLQQQRMRLSSKLRKVQAQAEEVELQLQDLMAEQQLILHEHNKLQESLAQLNERMNNQGDINAAEIEGLIEVARRNMLAVRSKLRQIEAVIHHGEIELERANDYREQITKELASDIRQDGSLEAIERRLQAKNKTIESLEDQLKKLNLQLVIRQESVAHLKEVDEFRDEEVRRLQKKLADSLKREQRARQEVRQIEAQILGQRSQMGRLRDQVGRSKEQLRVSKRQLATVSTARQRASLQGNRLNAKIKQLGAALAASDVRITELQQAILKATQQNLFDQQQRQALIQKCSFLQNHLGQLEAEMSRRRSNELWQIGTAIHRERRMDLQTLVAGANKQLGLMAQLLGLSRQNQQIDYFASKIRQSLSHFKATVQQTLSQMAQFCRKQAAPVASSNNELSLKSMQLKWQGQRAINARLQQNNQELRCQLNRLREETASNNFTLSLPQVKAQFFQRKWADEQDRLEKLNCTVRQLKQKLLIAEQVKSLLLEERSEWEEEWSFLGMRLVEWQQTASGLLLQAQEMHQQRLQELVRKEHLLERLVSSQGCKGCLCCQRSLNFLI